ncbi:47 kDa outer membrane protein precursor [Piscirickettsia salmonis]|uniref:Outer membrane protein P1 n=1 Tax=Piscirickettsia salmonis TaxID=1238 RepID=A0A9Q6LLF1_PISSA|nr:outer membrane protein transport protein [Piscirickettsia salmonis]QGN95701.1 Outer membrane protein P1 precursor [Piscirickettsia salmonis]QGO05348.1 Outer membrane protein P1 precursor [Piscirickettsia salmonis]QGO33669.1 Outer membrane protein P1 precursor [Piscirickettsia salmonis]QGO37281.1 47 kDa outer membrane protein precursor [Piscirickettsia salmonis]QGO40905.1 47 kDa outer membrane protein precursor [Piscirickettsia salmonis]
MSLFVFLKNKYLVCAVFVFVFVFFLFFIFFQNAFAVPVQYLTNSYLAGNAFAGAVTSANVAVMDSNPAILAQLSAPEVYISDSYIRSATNNSNAVATQSLSVSGITEAVSGQTSAGQATSKQVPSVFIAWPTSSVVSLGLTIVTGSSLNTEYNRQWVGRHLNTGMKLMTLAVTPIVAIKVTPQLSLGLGWHFQRNKFQSTGAAGLVGQASNYYSESATVWNQGFLLGGLYQWSKNTSIGLSYNHIFVTNLDATGTYSSKVSAQFPDTVNFGFRHRFNEKVVVMLNLQEVLWRQFYLQQHSQIAAGVTSSANSHLNLKNSHLLSLGMAYQLNRRNIIEWGVGVDDGKFTTSNHRLWLGLGLNHYFSKQASIGLSYLYGSPQTSQVAAVNPININIGQFVNPMVIQQINTLTMQSKNTIQILALGVHYRF